LKEAVSLFACQANVERVVQEAGFLIPSFKLKISKKGSSKGAEGEAKEKGARTK